MLRPKLWMLTCLLPLTCIVRDQGATAERFEIDLLRMMNGTFAPTTLSTTITLNNKSATAIFSGDTSSNQIEEVYVLFATTENQLTEIRLSNKNISKLFSYRPPHMPVDTPEKGKVTFSITNNNTWAGQATVEFPSMVGRINRYAMAARLSSGDPDSPSSYICSYTLKNSALSIPDLQVLDQYNFL